MTFLRQMRHTFVLVALIGIAGPAHASSDGAAAVETVIRSLQTHWNGADMDAYLGAYRRSDELRLVYGKSWLAGWDTVNRVFREQYPDEKHMGKFTIDKMEVRLLTDDIAVVTGSFEHVFPDETIRGAFTHVLQKTPDDGWEIQHEHTSRGETIVHDEEADGRER
jgi:uncharacterized protein (TIGR02246 family)